jgi:hypothetical protein
VISHKGVFFHVNAWNEIPPLRDIASSVGHKLWALSCAVHTRVENNSRSFAHCSTKLAVQWLFTWGVIKVKDDKF